MATMLILGYLIGLAAFGLPMAWWVSKRARDDLETATAFLLWPVLLPLGLAVGLMRLIFSFIGPLNNDRIAALSMLVFCAALFLMVFYIFPRL